MSKRILGAAAWLAIVGSWSIAGAQDLNVGDAPPKLEVKEFVKGDPVKQFEKGKTYVVEFWATWCGPCKFSIPHLTELQKKYKDVVFIGVSVWEQDAAQAEVKPFVKEMGDKMDYRVATDLIPDGKDPNDGKMAKNWMAAAKQGGIPSAFIINGDGKIVWIGHPMSIKEEQLEKIANGSWDTATAIAEFKKEKEKEKADQAKLAKIVARLQKAQQSGDPKEMLAAIDEAIELDPSRFEQGLAPMKFQTLAKGDEKKALEFGNKLVDGAKTPMDANTLNNIAWVIVDPDADSKPSAEMTKFALAASRRADKVVNGKEAAIADTYARALFLSGDAAEALKTQERAIESAKGNPQFENDQGMKDRLEQYRKAVKK